MSNAVVLGVIAGNIVSWMLGVADLRDTVVAITYLLIVLSFGNLLWRG